MRETVEALPPQSICDTYNEAQGSDRLESLFTEFGAQTIERISEGCICMAEIWASAWREGGGEDLPQSKLTAINFDDLTALVKDSTFLPSMALADMIPLLTGSDAAPVVARPRGRKKRAVVKKASDKAAKRRRAAVGGA
jgi:hypothetical protein